MIGTIEQIIQYLFNQDKTKKYEVNEYKEKRSLSANAYCWVLCDKIAKKLTVPDAVITKEDVYKDAILNIGTFQPMIVEEKAYDNLKRIWEKQGLAF